MAVSFVHIADVHIGTSFAKASFGYELGQKRREEIKDTFMAAVDYCEANAIDLLLIAGDLYNNEEVTISEVKDIRNKLGTLTKTQVVIEAGNHDAIINESSLYHLIEFSKNVHILETEVSRICFDTLNTEICGFSWDKKTLEETGYSDYNIENSKRHNILMLHGDAYTNSDYLPLNMKKLLKKGYDYIGLGHIHKPEVNVRNWAYPGSLEPLNFKETGEHGFVKGMIDDKGTSIEFVPFSKRRFITKEVVVNEAHSYEEIKALVLDVIKTSNMEEAMYRVILEGVVDGDVDINCDGIKAYVEESFFYCEIIDQTVTDFDLSKLKVAHKGNLIGEYISAMEQKGLEDPLVKSALDEGLRILLSQKVI